MFSHVSSDGRPDGRTEKLSHRGAPLLKIRNTWNQFRIYKLMVLILLVLLIIIIFAISPIVATFSITLSFSYNNKFLKVPNHKSYTQRRAPAYLRYHSGKKSLHGRADPGEHAMGCYARYQLNPRASGNGGISSSEVSRPVSRVVTYPYSRVYQPHLVRCPAQFAVLHEASRCKHAPERQTVRGIGQGAATTSHEIA